MMNGKIFRTHDSFHPDTFADGKERLNAGVRAEQVVGSHAHMKERRERVANGYALQIDWVSAL